MKNKEKLTKSEQALITEKIDRTTYHIGVFFSTVSKENLNDKMKRLIQNEALNIPINE